MAATVASPIVRPTVAIGAPPSGPATDLTVAADATPGHGPERFPPASCPITEGADSRIGLRC